MNQQEVVSGLMRKDGVISLSAEEFERMLWRYSGSNKRRAMEYLSELEGKLDFMYKGRVGSIAVHENSKKFVHALFSLYLEKKERTFREILGKVIKKIKRGYSVSSEFKFDSLVYDKLIRDPQDVEKIYSAGIKTIDILVCPEYSAILSNAKKVQRFYNDRLAGLIDL